ncbi:MAG: hypothetical protein HQK96_10680 [Nitrospirae bacterium]|nr:hypothetical protein [Nitrospirota bacterium]
MIQYPNWEEIEKDIISCKTLGCNYNNLRVDDLFEIYEEVGFLYPEKKKRILPYLQIIKDNWNNALKLGEDVLWFSTYEDQINSNIASFASYRSTYGGWVGQHLVSTGCPVYTAKIMIGAHTKVIRERDKKPYKSFQNWFSPNNKYASRVFGAVTDSIGNDLSVIIEYDYISIKADLFTNCKNINVKQIFNGNNNEITEFLLKYRGNVYIEAEELNDSDIELNRVNEIYKQVDLTRKRYIYIAYEGSSNKPAGMAIVLRGPFGLNFSNLENRCDIIVSDEIESDTVYEVCSALISSVKENYFDFLLGYIPVVTNNRTSEVLLNKGANMIRKYKQCIWLKEGYYSYYI